MPFSNTLMKTDEWMTDLKQELGVDDASRAHRVLRLVLHALRDRLVPGEASDLAAQLPQLIRGVYYEGWKPSRAPKDDKSAQGLIDEVGSQLGRDLGLTPELAIRSVFAVMHRHITSGAIEDIRSLLPSDLAELWMEPASA